MKQTQPSSPFLHARSAAKVAAVMCTETEPIILPSNDSLQLREAMVKAVHKFFKRLDEDPNNDQTITTVKMDTCYDLRLSVVGDKTSHDQIVMSFCSLDIRDIEAPLSSGGKYLYSQLEQFMKSATGREGNRSHMKNQMTFL